ncbi:MAG: cell division protein FtsZ [bacterium]|nr:cell division protein FtsZ [bacterium]
MANISPEIETFARIKVVGVGGSGKNATNHMINSKVRGVDFIAINTDSQDLHYSNAKKKIHIGKNLTRGLGTGMNPELGKRAIEENREEVQEALKGADMVFIAGGLGGGTCSGAAPTIARIAKELGALTVGVVTKPFFFEGKKRMQVADQALDELRKEVDAIIIIPNDRLLKIIDKNTTAKNAFAMCDEILRQAVEGISDLITTPGMINIDFADIRAVMENAGSALMGIGSATGENRAIEAAKLAINSPLLDLSILGAKGVLFSIAGNEDLTMFEIQDAARVITESIDPQAKVIYGTVISDKLKKNEVRITVIASGFPEDQTKLIQNDNSVPLFESKSTPVAEAPEPEEKRSRFFGSPSPTPEKEVKVEIKKEAPKPIDDEEDWGAVPAFLRRSKIK